MVMARAAGQVEDGHNRIAEVINPQAGIVGR